MRTVLQRSLGWGSLGLLFLAVAVVPLVSRATVCVDDFVWIANAWADRSLPRALTIAWSSNFFFRPIDILANRLVDPRTLDFAPILFVQIPGLLFLTAGMWRMLCLAGSAQTTPRIVATAWLWFHPATQLSVWSAGAASQTWCAAFGAWIICVALNLVGKPIGRVNLATLTLLSIAGVVVKELFVGWATVAAVVIVAGQVLGRGRPNLWYALKTGLPAICAVLVPPCVWIGSRLWFTQFGNVIHDSSGALYSLHGPAIVLVNLATSVLGMFVQGPIHWARLLSMPWVSVPFVGAALSCVFAFIGGTQSAGVIARVPKGLVLPIAVMLGVAAVWPSLLIGKVSELYMMGPNALIAALVGISATSGKLLSTLAGRIAASALFLIALIGFVSRTYHFTVTWSQARELREVVQRRVAAAPPGSRLVIVVPDSLQSGPMHSKYCVPPAVAAALPQSWLVKRLVDPALPQVQFVTQGEQVESESCAGILDAPSCRREMW